MNYIHRCAFAVHYTNKNGERIREIIHGNSMIATEKAFQEKYKSYIAQWHGISFLKYNR